VPRPWQIEFKGHIEKSFKIDVDELIKKMTLEERVYRHRCVERWVVIMPFIGFPTRKLVEFAKPTSKARFLRMVSFYRPGEAPGQRVQGPWSNLWPYHEGLTIEEAINELAFMVVGMYGKVLPSQNGAPIRSHTPWKYGYKSIKAITRFEFVEKEPSTFWHQAVPNEYDFQANVNPNKPHPRWSQAREQLVETGEVIPTRLYNGYGRYVAHLYK
jgi:sulfoxide reductase catalytic subunit YedY